MFWICSCFDKTKKVFQFQFTDKSIGLIFLTSLRFAAIPFVGTPGLVYSFMTEASVLNCVYHGKFDVLPVEPEAPGTFETL